MDIKKARDELHNGKTIFTMNLKVGYYARVSTDKDDQLNSLENQQNYFEEMIKLNKNWTLVKGYIDEGISGTQVKKRDSFLQMIEDATLGKIDLILTKEISRFSRNTVDSIKYTEYLLKKGVIVYFIADNLNTIQEDAEFRLTIMSSLAQDEVRKLSERVKFGINRMIKDGKLIGGNLTGYFKKKGHYEINPKESPIIEYLFTSYVSGNTSLKKISLELAKMGYLNTKKEPYSQTTLAKFLTNPRYKGYYTARITEVEDYKTHKKKKVPKEKQIIYKDEKIPAIISEELWDKANFLYEKRRKKKARHILNNDNHLKNYKYSGKLYCQNCGEVFVRSGGSNRSCNPVWVCKTYKTKGIKACPSPNIKENDLDKTFINLFNSLLQKENIKEVLKEYQKIMKSFSHNLELEEIKKKILILEDYKDKLLDLSIKGLIDNSEFKIRNDKYNEQISTYKSRMNEYQENNKQDKEEKKLKILENSLKKKLTIKDNLPYLVNLLIQKIEVKKINNNRKDLSLKISFTFKREDNTIHLDKRGKEMVFEPHF